MNDGYIDVEDFRPDAFWKKDNIDQVVFDPLWPTETKGDGKPRANNIRTGSAQGKGSIILKAPCKQCGFPNDINKVDHSGGSLDGNGAAYIASTGTASFVGTGGATYTEKYGVPAIHQGAGCALCGSKNNADSQAYIVPNQGWDKIQPTGF